MKSRGSLLRCLAFSFVYSSCISMGFCGDLAAKQDGNTPDYATMSNVQVIYGTVVAWEPDPECRGQSCLHYPLVRLRVEKALVGNWHGELTCEMRMPVEPWGDERDVVVGERVVLTFVSERRFEEWSCGRLRPCDHRPRRIMSGIEMYSPVHWRSH